VSALRFDRSAYWTRTPTPRQAVEIQQRLRDRVVIRDLKRPVRLIAGVDISVVDGRARAAVVLLDAKTLLTVEAVTAERRVPFPYVPGLLSFREIPVLVPAFRKLKRRPDLAMVDGMGYAHPRRFGIACHIGVLLDMPSLGCAKSLLVGTHAEPRAERGSWTPLRHGEETVGAAVRTRDHTNVVYASVGHRVTLAGAIAWILRTCDGYRLPEPIRAAHQEAGRWAV
jgi:deoxyribonuclease V